LDKKNFGTYDTELRESIKLAYEAGAVALTFCTDRRNNEALNVMIKTDKSPVTIVDKQVNDLVVSQLQKKFPNYRVIGEESVIEIDNDLGKGKVFLVDPIDGTKDFIANNGQWSVMIGLAVDGEAVVGVVYAAQDDEMFIGVKGHGAYMIKDSKNIPNPELIPIHCSSTKDTSQIRYLASRSNFDEKCIDTMKILSIPDSNLIYQGSMGIKLCMIASGRAELYVNAKGVSSYWDGCAPQVILEEAGGVFIDDKKCPVRYTGVDTHLRMVVTSTTSNLVDKVYEAIKIVYLEN
jgi:3'(2'), 5'-bisphosphate nucleotidase